MKKQLLLIVSAVFFITVGFIVSSPIKDSISQKDLDMATTPAKLSVTGTPLGEVSISHDGRNVSADSSFRDSYTNMGSPKETIKEGTVFTKRAYAKNKDGSKGNLLSLFAMIKREKGYFPEGGDWEYVSIPYDKAVDYKKHPNGILPDASKKYMRGKITMCGSCHQAAAGKDFVFTNSDEKAICKPKSKCNPCAPKTKCGPCTPKGKCNPCTPKSKCNPCKPK